MQAASSERAPSAPSSSHHIRASQSGAEWATAASSGVESSPSRASAELGAFAPRPAQDRVDEAGGVRRAGSLDQLDRLVDGGVVGRAVGEEQLVEAEAQGGEHRRVEQPRRALGEPLDRRVGGSAPLDRAVGEPLRLGALAPVDAPLRRGLAEGALGEGVLLEGRPEHLEGERPGRRDPALLGAQSGWPRR